MKKNRIVFLILSMVVGVGGVIGIKSVEAKKKRIPPYYVYTWSGSYHLYPCCYEPGFSGCGTVFANNFYYSDGTQLIHLNVGTPLTPCP